MDQVPSLIVLADRIFGCAVAGGTTAVAVVGQRIERVGGRAEILGLRGRATRVLDFPGGLLCPGFQDAHAHLVHAGTARLEIDLHGLDVRGIAAAVRSAAAGRAPGRWIVGSGYDPDVLEGAGTTPRTILDEAAPEHPVLLRTHDYHSAALNGPGLEATGLRRETPDTPGGEIVRDGDGRLTGIVRENAAWQAEAGAGDLTQREQEDAVEATVPELHRAGITALHDMSGSRALSVLRALDDRGRLGLDVFATLTPEDLDRPGGTVPGDRLRVVGVKAFLDGALGSRTALLLDPYESDPTHRGISTLSPEATVEHVAAAARAGLPTFLHAIGNGAVRSALDALVTSPTTPDGRRLRHRVEHAQMIHDEDLPRFHEGGIVASAQPVHMALDAPLVLRHWGSRSREAFPLRRLLDSGAVLAFGSDGPIETFDVLEGIRAAVGRRGRDGTVLHPEEAVTCAEALRAYTWGAAWAAGQEQHFGAVREGGIASLTLLDRDVENRPGALADCRVVATVVRGEVVFEDRAA